MERRAGPGVPGISKPFRQRYRLRPFRVGHAELAIRHGARVVPAAVVGAEEQLPLVLVSVELDEVMALADRILVLYRGRIQGELEAGTATEEQVGILMAGGTLADLEALRQKEASAPAR